MADFRSNLAAEAQGRLQAVRLYEMTADPGVRDMLAFLIARDHYHQLQWMAAIEELEAEGLEGRVVPSAFPMDRERTEHNNELWNFSSGEESATGRWMNITVDGKQIEYVDNPEPLTDDTPSPGAGHPKVYSTVTQAAYVGARNGSVTDSVTNESRP